MLSDRQIYLIIRSSYSSVSSVPVTESAISPPTLRASCLPLPAAGQSAGRAVSPLPCGGAGCSCWFGVSSLRQRALSHTSGCGVASLRRAIPPLQRRGRAAGRVVLLLRCGRVSSLRRAGGLFTSPLVGQSAGLETLPVQCPTGFACILTQPLRALLS